MERLGECNFVGKKCWNKRSRSQETGHHRGTRSTLRIFRAQARRITLWMSSDEVKSCQRVQAQLKRA
eukprot:6183793-Pleurochrysis_carterae.AAC.2